MIKALTFCALPLIAFSTVAEARTRTLADLRGYNTCQSEFRAESNGLVTDRHHYIDKRGKNPRYYINGIRWENGDRAAVKMACETHPNGSQILFSEISAGRYAGQKTRITIEVADSSK